MSSAMQGHSVSEMGSYVRRWERHLRAQNKSPKTIKSYREAALQLAAYLVEEGDHDGDPTTVTHADVEEFIAHLNATRSPSTGRTRFAALQQLFKWLRVVEHEIDTDPMADLDPPKVGEVQVRPFSFEERQAILDTVPKRSRDFLTRRDRAILYLLIDTGVRRSECANLTLADVHDDGSLTVHGKGDRRRRINVGETARDALERYLAVRRKHPKAPSSDRLWLAQKGPLTPDGLYQVVVDRAGSAGVADVHPHRFRHTAAHFWLVRGGAEVDLMAHMGWSTMQMVQRYTKSAAQDRARGVHQRLALGNEHG
jgi:site-specific recombinase XerD